MKEILALLAFGALALAVGILLVIVGILEAMGRFPWI